VSHPESKSRITEPERIQRILTKASDAKLGALIRLSESDKKAVRGSIVGVESLDGVNALIVGALSEKGVQYLSHASTCIIELVTVRAKIVFSVFVIRFTSDSVMLTFPTEMVNIERRKNARYSLPENQAAFLELNGWNPKVTDLEAPPVIPGMDPYSPWIKVGDLSVAGASAHLQCPGKFAIFERGYEDQAAKLHLPGRDPLSLHCVIRWTKQVSDWTDSSARGHSTRVLAMGFEFCSIQESVRLELHRMIREISTSNAV
jgi:c-di-GMP-binding flagellar brake protein YcgR